LSKHVRLRPFAPTCRHLAGSSAAHADDELSDREGVPEPQDSGDDEWSPSGVIVRGPDRTSGRGSHDPHQVKQFKDLFSNGEPIPIAKHNWRDIQIGSHRSLFRQVCSGAQTVPEWVMFTKYGMACKVCM